MIKRVTNFVEANFRDFYCWRLAGTFLFRDFIESVEKNIDCTFPGTVHIPGIPKNMPPKMDPVPPANVSVKVVVNF